jgi:hypothetical protein
MGGDGAVAGECHATARCAGWKSEFDPCVGDGATTDRPSAVAMALSPTIPAHVTGVSWS